MEYRVSTNVPVESVKRVEAILVPHEDMDGVIDYIDLFVENNGYRILEKRYIAMTFNEMVNMLVGEAEEYDECESEDEYGLTWDLEELYNRQRDMF